MSLTIQTSMLADFEGVSKRTQHKYVATHLLTTYGQTSAIVGTVISNLDSVVSTHETDIFFNPSDTYYIDIYFGASPAFRLEPNAVALVNFNSNYGLAAIGEADNLRLEYHQFK